MFCSTSSSSSCVATNIIRTSFGLCLLFVGLTHYMTIPSFVTMVSADLGPLTPLGMAWAYILPGLLISGGVLYALGMYIETATWLTGIGLASIPAGLLLKPIMAGLPLSEAMPPAVNAFVWVIVYVLVSRCCTSKA